MLNLIWILFLIFLIGAWIFGLLSLYLSFRYFIEAKKKEKDFFRKNIDQDKIWRSVWMQFWRLMRKKKYFEFENQELKREIRKIYLSRRIGMIFIMVTLFIYVVLLIVINAFGYRY